MAAELAWAAGFFDGEGSSSGVVKPNEHGPSVYLRINQVDRRPLERFLRAVGLGQINGPYVRKIGKPQCVWQVAGFKSDIVMALLWPSLSEPKREQYERAVLHSRSF